MKTHLQIRYYIAYAVLSFVSAFSMQAQVLFETNFTTEEGWVKEGKASSELICLERDITYDGKTFHIVFNQVAIDPAATNGDGSVGKATIQKNGNANTDTKPSTKPANNGYILFPSFDEDFQVSFSYASSSKADRTIAVEYSIDGGQSWLCTKEGLAPLHSSVSANFKCPTKFEKGTLVRLTNHSKGGGLDVFWVKIEKFVEDLEAPTAVSFLPENGAVEISPATRTLEIVFSEPVKDGAEGSVYVVGNTSGANCQITSGQLIFENQTVIIPIPNDFFLAANETYTVLLEDGVVKDLANNKAGEITWSFTTKVNVSAENNIISFKVPKQVDAVIDAEKATVNVTVAYGVDLANITENDIKMEISEYATVIMDYKNFAEGPQQYEVTAENGSKKTWTITITVLEYSPASLPVSYLGSEENSWKNIAAPGWLTNLINDDNTTKYNNYQYTQANVSKYGHFVQCWYDGPANRLSFRIRYGKATSNYEIKVEQSVTGEEDSWTEVVTYKPTTEEIPTEANPDLTPMIPTVSSTLGLRSYPLNPDSRYVRWFYSVRTNTSFYLDDVVIENVAEDTQAPVLLTDEEVVYHMYSDSTKSQIVLKFSEAVKVSEDIIACNASIGVSGGTCDAAYYEPNLLAMRDGELILTDLPALEDQTEYTITIPANALVDLAGNAFAGTTVKFTTDFTKVDPNPSMIKALKASDVLVYYVNGNVIVDGEFTSAQLYNTMGVLLGISEDGRSIPASALADGVYFVRYIQSNGAVGTVKIYINK